MATLGLKEMGKFLQEGREKVLPSWLSQLSFAKLRQTTGLTFFPTFPMKFPISFKPKVAIAELFCKMQRKTWYSIKNLLLIKLVSFIAIINLKLPMVLKIIF